MMDKNSVPIKINSYWYFKDVDGKLNGYVQIIKGSGLNFDTKEIKLNESSSLIFEQINGTSTIKQIEMFYKGLFKDDIDYKIIENDVNYVIEYLIKIKAVMINFDSHKFYDVIGKYYFE